MANMLSMQMDGSIDSWAIRWCYAQSKLDMLTVYPIRSQIQNIGLDGSGTHSGFATRYSAILGSAPNAAGLCEPFLDRRIVRASRDFHGSRYQYFRSTLGTRVKGLIQLGANRRLRRDA